MCVDYVEQCMLPLPLQKQATTAMRVTVEQDELKSLVKQTYKHILSKKTFYFLCEHKVLTKCECDNLSSARQQN